MKIQDYNNINLSLSDSVALITLNRPSSLNALSEDLLNELEAILIDIENDKDILIFIITGANREDGRPCFSAGADIKNRKMTSSPKGEPLAHTIDGMRDLGNEVFPKNQSRYNEVFTMLENMQTPSIAALDGICTTGGLELILSCDMRIVGAAVEISDWHTKNLQAIGGAGVTSRLPKLVGPSKAKEILWTGKIVNADEAVAIGLANQKFSSEKLIEEAMSLATTVASMSPFAISASKAVINKSHHQSTQDSIRFAQIWSALIAAQKEDQASLPPPHPLND
ncbi:MAG: enoyl-CoA hydratase-related protein [Dehalococcoidia bacterium]|nr:enoyl-CoA hydratase-related protein [Dehalococcoidia bacterium]